MFLRSQKPTELFKLSGKMRGKANGAGPEADLLSGKDLKAGPPHEVTPGLHPDHDPHPEEGAAAGVGGRAGPGGAGREGGQSPERGREAGATTWSPGPGHETTGANRSTRGLTGSRYPPVSSWTTSP